MQGIHSLRRKRIHRGTRRRYGFVRSERSTLSSSGDRGVRPQKPHGNQPATQGEGMPAMSSANGWLLAVRQDQVGTHIRQHMEPSTTYKYACSPRTSRGNLPSGRPHSVASLSRPVGPPERLPRQVVRGETASNDPRHEVRPVQGWPGPGGGCPGRLVYTPPAPPKLAKLTLSLSWRPGGSVGSRRGPPSSTTSEAAPRRQLIPCDLQRRSRAMTAQACAPRGVP